jgi:hypothetical protein
VASNVSNDSFLVEEFINAITSQLDRVQDALRIKAVNRPLTYALKDFFMELQVFVEMDGERSVRFRTNAPNETGASTIRIGFTTITKPMIEENTISLAMTRSPSLEELGLDPAERLRLEQFGVRNAAQLRRLGSSTGATSVSRISGIPVDRLRQALQLGHPQINNVKLERVGDHQPHIGPVLQPHPLVSPIVRTAPPVIQPERPRLQAELNRPSIQHRLEPRLEPDVPIQDDILALQSSAEPGTPARATTDSYLLSLTGNNLVGENGAPLVRLNNQPLEVTQADDNEIIIAIRPQEVQSGPLEIELPDGKVLLYTLSFEPDQQDDPRHEQLAGEEPQDHDPWLAPKRGDA